MGLTFSTSYHGTMVRAEVARPLATRFSLFVGDKLVAEASRPVSTDIICGIRTWFGQKPKWEITGSATIDGVDCKVAAVHFTTFTRQYIELYVNGELLGPEATS